MAESQHTTDETPGKSAERLARDARLADAFRDMESDFHDLRHMANIAFQQACSTAQGIYACEVVDRSHLDRMAFAVGHVEDMINDLYRKWDDSFSGQPESNATGEVLR